MKKLVVGALVGGLLIFIWQFFSWTLLDLHRPAQQYTPKQDSVLRYLSSQFAESGGYFLPTFPKGASMEQQQELMKASEGKPWAIVSYHKTMNADMATNLIRGVLVNIILVGLFCWIILQINRPSFGMIFFASLFTGLIVFLNEPYTIHIWYETFDLMAHFFDALISWGITGLWLGFWLRSKR